jgi:hypothetical protein
MHCWYGFFRLLLSCLPLWVSKVATLAACAGTMWVLLVIFRNTRDQEETHRALRFSALAMATVMVSPHLLSYDLTLLVLPMLLLADLLLENGEVVRRQRRALAWSLAALYVSCAISPELPRHTTVQVSVPMMFAVLLLLASIARRSFRVETSEAGRGSRSADGVGD